ncbi:MAG: WD40/YVTN/BNR-like repeat-containing protein [Candidatus Dormibacteria bacterium]
MVSRDGGASWTTAHLPGGTSTGGVSAISGSTIFAAGSVTKATSTCDGAVWESTDAGSLWRMLPGSCSQAPLYSVQFLTSRIGFAGGGQLPSFSQPPGRVLLGTTDGGASWSIVSEQTRPSQLASPIVQLHFITNELGTLITGGCDPGANGPCGGHVYTTADGGHSLQRTAQMGTELSTVRTRDIWVVDFRNPQISVTYDAGAEWSTLPGLGEVRIGAISFQSGSLVLSTSGGTYTSSDGGRHWAYIGTAAVAGYAPPNVVTLDGESVSIEPARGSGPGTVVHLSAAGPVGLTAAVFATLERGIVFGTGSQCLKPQIAPTPTTVYVTLDGGLKWRRTATLNMAVNQAAYAGSFAAAVGEAGCHGEMAISVDGGLRWRVGAIPSSCQDPSLTAAGATWLTCATQGAQGFAYLASGSTSSPLRAKHRLQGLARGAMFVVAANGDLYAVGDDDGANVLWVSRDGGRTWRGALLSLPAG